MTYASFFGAAFEGVAPKLGAMLLPNRIVAAARARREGADSSFMTRDRFAVRLLSAQLHIITPQGEQNHRHGAVWFCEKRTRKFELNCLHLHEWTGHSENDKASWSPLSLTTANGGWRCRALLINPISFSYFSITQLRFLLIAMICYEI
jgi:hypothetical protein